VEGNVNVVLVANDRRRSIRILGKVFAKAA
jgi:hypothetical protein